jgi:hypothetical protein
MQDPFDDYLILTTFHPGSGRIGNNQLISNLKKIYIQFGTEPIDQT